MNKRIRGLLLFASGVAVGVALPVIVPAVIEGGRPLAKALLKHGTQGLQRLQVLAARAGEALEDLMAEVRAEVQHAPSSAAPAATDMVMPDKSVLS